MASKTFPFSQLGEAMAPSIVTDRQTGRKYHVVVARETLRAYQTKGYLKDPVRRVDGSLSKPETQVRWGGYISYLARDDLGEVVEKIYRRLVEKSPILTGDYSHAHVFMVNGRVVTKELAKDQDVISIVNVQPYARKIEHGLSSQAPTGVYQLVARWAQRQFRGLQISFSYIRIPSLGVTFQDRKRRGRPGRRTGKKIRTPIVYPVIHIRNVPQ